MAEGSILISERVGKANVHAAPGSIQGKCMKCGHAVWIAPTSLPLDLREFWCMDCAKKDPVTCKFIASHGTLHVPGQAQEFRKVTGRSPPTQETIKEYFNDRNKRIHDD